MARKAKTSVVRHSGAFKDPVSKADLISRILSREFSGDLADLAVNRDLRYERPAPNVLGLKFGVSGKMFQLVVRKPRTPEQLAAMRAKDKEVAEEAEATDQETPETDDAGGETKIEAPKPEPKAAAKKPAEKKPAAPAAGKKRGGTQAPTAH
jgi:hypothetical protein